MVAYRKTQQRKNEESERLRGEEDKSSLSILDWKGASFRIQEGTRQDVP